jgi:thioredoxin reductase (NADPH)
VGYGKIAPMSVRDLVIVGAGPAGLAAAIAAKAAGLDYIVLEKGVLVNSIYRFPPNMIFFTTPELLEIGGLPLVSPFEKPTRLEALRYYRRVADTHAIDIEYDVEVLAVGREPHEGDEIFAVDAISRGEATATVRGRHVILAIGYYDHPNLLGVPGEDLPHVRHYYTEAHPFYRRRVVVVGGGNSAAETALDLYRSGARVTLVHYRDVLKPTIKYWVKPDIENRLKEGSIEGRFRTRVVEINKTSVVVERDGIRDKLPADAVFLLTGYHPDFTLLRQAGVEIDPESGVARYDPDTLESNVPGLFLAGGAISGRDTEPIFIENGRFHGERIVRTLVERRRVVGAQ